MRQIRGYWACYCRITAKDPHKLLVRVFFVVSGAVGHSPTLMLKLRLSAILRHVSMPTLYHPFSTACTALVLVLALDRKKKKSEKKSGRQIACQPLNKHFTMKKKSIKQLFASKFPVEQTTSNADGKSPEPHESRLPPS